MNALVRWSRRSPLDDIAIIWDDKRQRRQLLAHLRRGTRPDLRGSRGVLRDDGTEIEVSRSSGRPTAFGWTSSGERIGRIEGGPRSRPANLGDRVETHWYGPGNSQPPGERAPAK